MPLVRFLWDNRPGANIDHIASHGMTTSAWEDVYRRAMMREADKDDATIFTAEGKSSGRLYRIVYGIYGDIVIPLTVIPITGFPISRRSLRRRTL